MRSANEIVADISENMLKNNGIVSISVIQEEQLQPRMIIKYENATIETIDDTVEMEKFVQKLQK